MSDVATGRYLFIPNSSSINIAGGKAPFPAQEETRTNYVQLMTRGRVLPKKLKKLIEKGGVPLNFDFIRRKLKLRANDLGNIKGCVFSPPSNSEKRGTPHHPLPYLVRSPTMGCDPRLPPIVEGGSHPMLKLLCEPGLLGPVV